MSVVKFGLIAVGLAVASPSIAQNIEFGPGGLRVGPERQERVQREEITRRDAVRIARRQGVVDVDSVRETRSGWTIDGSDRDGDDVTVRVSATGEVLDVRR